MKRKQQGCVENIVFVPGDGSTPRLGLSDSDYHDLSQHVNIVLHLAANVRFGENLKVMVETNVKGTQEIIQLCRDCISLKVSIVYSEHLQIINFRFYTV
ncbi:hypothetical protein PR048_022874 [Dryococelus australis]|uniref:Fatty acyl-CoA reductase n=1 Tax=Dryococelus australis TaxID=614101 RepID=A0ABQ9GSH6_9NEOP|nr:hypothetical protein PR048_022874 [Dryococelus australis]